MYHLQKLLRQNASAMVKHIVVDVYNIKMNPTTMDKVDMIKRGFEEGESFFVTQFDNTDTDTPHVTIKSTFLMDDIETSQDVEEVVVKQLPSLNELIQEVIKNSNDTNKLIDVLHSVLEYARTGKDDDHFLNDIIRSLPILSDKNYKHTENDII
jgi:hypothetical protein